MRVGYAVPQSGNLLPASVEALIRNSLLQNGIVGPCKTPSLVVRAIMRERRSSFPMGLRSARKQLAYRRLIGYK